MSELIELLDQVHDAFKHHATDQSRLKNDLGGLVARYGRTQVMSAMIECSAICYLRLHHTTARLKAYSALAQNQENSR